MSKNTLGDNGLDVKFNLHMLHQPMADKHSLKVLTKPYVTKVVPNILSSFSYIGSKEHNQDLTKKFLHEIPGIGGSKFKGSLVSMEIDWLDIKLKDKTSIVDSTPVIFLKNNPKVSRILQTTTPSDKEKNLELLKEKKRVNFFMKKSNSIKTIVEDPKHPHLVIDDYLYIEGFASLGVTRKFRVFGLLCEEDYLIDTDK